MKKIAYRLLFSLMLTLPVFMASAQDEEEVNAAGFRFLDYGNDMPEGLFSGKTAVLVTTLPKEGTSLRSDWKGMAKEAHPTFKEAGIDAVGYYYMEDVMAGKESTRAYSEQFKKREIKYLLLLNEVMLDIKGRLKKRYAVVITPFNEEADLMNNGQKAWKAQGNSLSRVLKKVEKEARRSSDKKENLLIIDVPEFFEPFNIIQGKRYEAYPVNLKVDKLAVPKLEEHNIPQDRPGGMLNNQLAKQLEEENQEIKKQNKVLNRIFLEYPYEYTIVDPDQTEEQLKNQRYQFVIYRLHSTGRNIRKMLGYEEDDAEDYVTVKNKNGQIIMRTIPANAPVYKYYAKQLFTGDIYVGSKWDADEEWNEALENFLRNLKEEAE